MDGADGQGGPLGAVEDEKIFYQVCRRVVPSNSACLMKLLAC
jgi:hypothetical protein